MIGLKCLCLVMTLVVTFGKTVFLSPSGTDINGCGSRDSPCKTIVYSLQTHENPKMILLDGIYEGEGNLIVRTTGNFELESDSKNPTKVILSGNFETSLFTIEGADLVNVSHVTFQKFNSKGYYTSSLNIVGCHNAFLNDVHFLNSSRGALRFVNQPNFEVKNSYFYGNYMDMGGAIYIEESNGKIFNSNFEYNSHFNYGTVYSKGSEVLLDSCLFKGNKARNGAGIYTQTSNLKILMSRFIENLCSDTVSSGAGIYSIINHQTIIENSIFQNNICQDGPVLETIRSSEFLLKDSIIENNHAKVGVNIIDGGKLENVIVRSNDDIGVSVYQDNIQLEGLQLTDNKGSGLYIDCKDLRFTNSIISNNRAFSGGGIHIKLMEESFMKNISIFNNTAQFGGGIYFEKSPYPRKLNDVKIFYNNAERGGGIYTDGGNLLDIIDSEIKNNYAVQGAGIYMNQAVVDFERNVISDNHASREGGGVFCFRGRFFGSSFIEENKVDNMKCQECRGC